MVRILRGFVSALALSGLLFLSPKSEAQNAFPYQSAEIAKAVSQGDYEQAIRMATDLLNRANVADPSLLYLRGYAEWCLCYFGDAEADLRPLADFQPMPNWPVASELIKQIDEMKALCPPHVVEVKDKRNVLFRVYYYEDNAWTKAIRALLPKAFEIGAKMYGMKVYQTTVLIFGDTKNYEKFQLARSKKSQITSWEWASASQGILLFCRTDPAGKMPAEDTEGDYFRGTVVHEYSHALLHRRLPATSVPRWFDEGIAMFAASRIVPNDITKNDAILRRCFDQDTLVELKDLTDFATFNAMVEKEAAEHRSGTGPYSGTDTYQQSFHMVRYYILHSKDADRARFLDALSETKDMEKAFQAVYGVSVAKFYESWKRDAAKGLPAPAKER